MIFKCKMCGGALEINNNESVVNCEYCGTQQTLPKLDDERRANLYDRANHFRRNNEFDKAMGIYEQILNEDNTDAEAYWSLVLCRYGIEYVEDPLTRKRVPTVNRAQFTSVYDDNNYKSALQYADSFQKVVYEEEAKAINEIQKDILAISQKEEPFDVFICYKESDSNGRRTPDSVLANDLYHQLTQEGFKVFFSRITLEDKLGSAYEPYIFAAINSAKVMVALGTRPEYFKAVWVKNEWSRYLALCKQGEKKMLIPAYKDMDPYDLPEEFSHLQAQDMSKLGFMQDLIRGIKKILEADAPKTTVIKETVVSESNANIAPLLKRVFIFLEDGDWSSADEYCERVLDLDPECAEAYLGKLMSELKVRRQEALKDCAVSFENSNNYIKALRYADENLNKELQSYIDFIIERNKLEKYTAAVELMKYSLTEDQYLEASKKFMKLGEYKNSSQLAEVCAKRAKEARLSELYGVAILAMDDAKSEGELKTAANLFIELGDYKDSYQKSEECVQRAEEIRLSTLYNSAMASMNGAKNENDFINSANKFTAIESYRDSKILSQMCLKKAEVCRKDSIYNNAITKMKITLVSSVEEAINLFQSIEEWKDSKDKISECENIISELQETMKKEEAARLEAERIEKKKAKKRRLIVIWTTSTVVICAVVIILLINVIIPLNRYNNALDLMSKGKYEEAITAFEKVAEYKDSADKIEECKIAILQNKYNIALEYMQNKQYDEAANIFLEISEYDDSETQYKEARYQLALTYWNDKNFEVSDEIFRELKNYKDSADKIHVHDYTVELLIEQGCEIDGCEEYTCKECSYSYTQKIEKTGHTYSTVTVTKQPTCTQKGERKLVCNSCGDNVTEEIAMIEHSYTSKVIKAATCESNGTKILSCSCGKSYTETINATGHKYDSGKVTTQATCDKDGVKTFTCSCGKKYTESIAKTGHAYSEATCTTASKCSKCGHVRQAALGHEDCSDIEAFKDYRCIRCDANLSGVYSNVIDNLGWAVDNYHEIFSKHGIGTYRITIKILEVDYTRTDSSGNGAHVMFKTSNPHDDVLISEGNPKSGMVLVAEAKLDKEYEFRYNISCCKVEILIEPIS